MTNLKTHLRGSLVKMKLGKIDSFLNKEMWVPYEADWLNASVVKSDTLAWTCRDQSVEEIAVGVGSDIEAHYKLETLETLGLVVCVLSKQACRTAALLRIRRGFDDSPFDIQLESDRPAADSMCRSSIGDSRETLEDTWEKTDRLGRFESIG